MAISYLILVCNASKAAFYLTDKKYPQKKLQCIAELIDPKSRLKGMDLVTDRPGHYQTNHLTRGAYEESITPQEREKDQFAKCIAEWLEKKYTNHVFDQLMIITPSHFLGLLEKHFSRAVSACLTHVIQKDYTQLSEPELRVLLQQRD